MIFNINKKLYIALTGLLLASACSLTPDYKRPETVADIMQEYSSTTQNASLKTDYDQGLVTVYNLDNHAFWWENINDPVTEKLIANMLSQNLRLEAAAERIVQARERTTIAGADLYPALSLNSGASRVMSPTNAQNNGFQLGSDRIYQTNYDLNIGASWQADLFGKIKAGQNAAIAETLVSTFDRQALLHTLIAELINRRVAIANTQAQIELTNQVIKTREQVLNSVNIRYEAGSEGTSALQVRRARENLAVAKSDLPPLISALNENIFALDVLLGMPPNSNESIKKYNFPSLPPPRALKIPPPLALIDQRPDLQSQELRLIAAGQDIGVAMADLYPGISLGGNYGFTTAQTSTLLSSEQLAWSLTGSILTRIFEGGRLRANIRVKDLAPVNWRLIMNKPYWKRCKMLKTPYRKNKADNNK